MTGPSCEIGGYPPVRYGAGSQVIADLPIGARGGLRHHRATAKEYCPLSSTAARHSGTGTEPAKTHRFDAFNSGTLRAMMARPCSLKPDHPARSRPEEIAAALRGQSAARPDALPSRDGAAPCKEEMMLGLRSKDESPAPRCIGLIGRRFRRLPDGSDACRGHGAGGVIERHPAICLGQFRLAVEP